MFNSVSFGVKPLAQRLGNSLKFVKLILMLSIAPFANFRVLLQRMYSTMKIN